MGFGGVVSMGALVTAAAVFGREHIQVDSFVQASQMFVPAFGAWGTTLSRRGWRPFSLGRSRSASDSIRRWAAG
jgi:hypothetical protein